MASRLTELAAELVRGSRAPRVLDYATPEPPQSDKIWLRLCNEIEYWGGARYFGLLAVGAAMFFGGIFLGGVTGMILRWTGAFLFLLTRTWRAWRDMKL
jgi:hypothetical protein